MTVVAELLGPGDVIVLRTPNVAGWWIRRRALIQAYRWQPWRWLSDKATLVNHVALFTHIDSDGNPRGLEGRPGGFGWVNLTVYLADPNTISNAEQPKTDGQRERVINLAAQSVGIPYDWAAIVAFAAGAAGLPFLPREWPEQGLPSHMVCSSAADYFYEAAGLANPGGDKVTRQTAPQDWAAFVEGKLWLTQG